MVAPRTQRCARRRFGRGIGQRGDEFIGAAGIAAANALATWIYRDSAVKADDEDYVFNSDVAISAAREEDIGELAASRQWTLTGPNAAQRVWTDDYSNILSAYDPD